MGVIDLPTVRIGAARSGCGCSSEARSDGLERLRYFQRQLLTAEDMTVEQDYFREKLRRHNRYLHGWGVVCGLEVTAAPTGEAPWRVRIGEGYALGPQGDEILVAEHAFLDLADCGPGATTDPCEPSLLRAMPSRGGMVYVAIKYSECSARPVRGAVACGCDDTSCEYSRVRDSFELECLGELPPGHRQPPPDICRTRKAGQIVPCPPEVEDPWVVLARVSLPKAEVDVADKQIDNLVRRQLYSTWAIQEQLIKCCCGPSKPEEEPTPTPNAQPVRVATVSPADQAVVTSQNLAEVVITFDKDVQAGTVNTATFQVFVADTSNQVPGSVTYEPSSRKAIFRCSKPFVKGKYAVLVRGENGSHVIDVDALALDGNKDGAQGDNFKSSFEVKP